MVMFTHLAVLMMPVTGSTKPGMISLEMEGKEKPSLLMAMMFMSLAGLITVLATGKMGNGST